MFRCTQCPVASVLILAVTYMPEQAVGSRQGPVVPSMQGIYSMPSRIVIPQYRLRPVPRPAIKCKGSKAEWHLFISALTFHDIIVVDSCDRRANGNLVRNNDPDHSSAYYQPPLHVRTRSRLYLPFCRICNIPSNQILAGSMEGEPPAATQLE